MASELKEHDFLKQSEEETLRQEARNILSSYSQVYDVLAESLQNAVDAVDERYSQEPTTATAKIAIEFDAPERSITVTDTGTGIPWDMLQNAPAPNITYKQGTGTARTRHQRSRGEKGVGLSFLTFACNLLRVTTCNGSETIEVEVHKANDWVQGRISERPKLTPTTSVPSPVSEKLDSQKYTQIQLIDLKTQDYCDRDIFDMSLRELLYTLRTKTAVGHTKAVILESTPEPEIEVSLSFVREDGEETTQRVPYKYLSPEEYLSERSILPYERFLELLKMDRLNTARGKALVYRNQQTTPGGRSINCYAFAMAPRAFADIAKDREIEEGWEPGKWSGIFIATRGMPTGIEIDPPATYNSGCWRRVFMLLEDDEMNFDVGRKSLQGRAKPMMQEVAEKIWSDISPYLQRLTPADPESVVRKKQGKLYQLFQEAQQDWPDLAFEKVQYLKQPRREQMVVALFYELVGAGVLKGYRTVRNNTVDQYDAFVRYSIDKSEIGKLEAAHVAGARVEDDLIVEFKHNADSILDDILENSKRYQDIQLLVCWELDAELLEKKSIVVEPVPSDSQRCS